MTSASTDVLLKPNAPGETVSAIPPADAKQRKARERHHALMRNVRHALLGSLLLAASAAALLALRPEAVPVDATSAIRGPLVVAIEEDGITRVKDRFVVSAPVTGSLSRLALEPGDLVREGDALAEIAPATSPLLDERTRAEAEARLGATLSSLGQARAQVARAQVAKELAEQEAARARRLAANGSIAPQALEEADFAVRMRAEELSSATFGAKVAEEEVRSAKVALGREGSLRRDRHVDILAPVSGRILRVHRKSAGIVRAPPDLPLRAGRSRSSSICSPPTRSTCCRAPPS